jgi:multidrug transporter EmrE-like cation transporter
MPPDLARLALVIGYALVSVSGMVLIKGADTVVSLKSGLGFALYIISFAIWTGVILRVMPLSQAFPLASGFVILGSQVAGWLLFKERMVPVQALGAATILLGVILMSAHPHTRG